MTTRLILRCDGTERPTLSLERCRAFLPLRSSIMAVDAKEYRAAGWERTTSGPDGFRHLCPACARHAREVTGRGGGSTPAG